MAGSLKDRNLRNVSDSNTGAESLDIDVTANEIEIYAKEIVDAIIDDNLPPTPNNFSLYFDRLLEQKDENVRKQIASMLELEESNDDENTILLEQNLKHGFTSIKSILSVTANLYKNMSLMTKILDKRKKDLQSKPKADVSLKLVGMLEGDVGKLNTILKKQSSQMRILYDKTATIVKNVENETIFDNVFGVYNKRYLMTKIKQEISLVEEFKYKSSFIMVELYKDIKKDIHNDKAILLMTRTVARLLLKTSRRSDIVAHYGDGKFAMLLKHTDIESAKKASERLCYLVSNSNFFLADREIQLKIAIGITDIDSEHTVEEIVVSSIDAIDMAYEDKKNDFAVLLREDKKDKKEEK